MKTPAMYCNHILARPCLDPEVIQDSTDLLMKRLVKAINVLDRRQLCEVQDLVQNASDDLSSMLLETGDLEELARYVYDNAMSKALVMAVIENFENNFRARYGVKMCLVPINAIALRIVDSDSNTATKLSALWSGVYNPGDIGTVLTYKTPTEIRDGLSEVISDLSAKAL